MMHSPPADLNSSSENFVASPWWMTAAVVGFDLQESQWIPSVTQFHREKSRIKVSIETFLYILNLITSVHMYCMHSMFQCLHIHLTLCSSTCSSSPHVHVPTCCGILRKLIWFTCGDIREQMQK